MIKEFTQYIENNTTLTIGTDLFMGHIPDKKANGDPIDTATVIIETDGITDPWQPDRVDWHIQILSRGTSWYATRTTLWAVHDEIKSNMGLETPNIDKQYMLMFIEVKNQPTYIGLDKENRYTFTANYLIRLREM